MARNWTRVLVLPSIDGAITSPSDAIRPRRPMSTSSRPTMMATIHGETRTLAQQRDQHARDEQLVGGRVEERPELGRDVPAAREAAVDPVRRGGDAEQQRGQRLGVVAALEDERHDHRREDDPHGGPRGEHASGTQSAPAEVRGCHERG